MPCYNYSPFKSVQKASITLSTHSVSEMSAGSCCGSIPCTESIDFSNNETKAISAHPPPYSSESHTAAFASSVFQYSFEMVQVSLMWSFVDFETLALGALFDSIFTCGAIGLVLTEASKVGF